MAIPESDGEIRQEAREPMGGPEASRAGPIPDQPGDAGTAAADTGCGVFCAGLSLTSTHEGGRAARWAVWNRTIRCRLTFLVLLVGLFAVLLELGFMHVYLEHRLHPDAAAEAGIVVRDIDRESGNSLQSGDWKATQAVLNGLALNDRVVAASVRDRDGRVVAGYPRAGLSVPPNVAPPGGARFEGNTVAVTQGISPGGKTDGTITVVYNFTPMMQGARRHFMTGVLVLLILMPLWAAAVVWLTGAVTGPLAHLAKVARSISDRRDYSLRAEGGGTGEIGQLIEAFNGMVAQIEMHDRARVAAEESLRRSEERYALAARGSNDGLWDFDATTGVAYLSPRMNLQVGDPETETWRTIDDWMNRMHPEDRERVGIQMAEFLESDRTSIELEYRMRHLDGHYIWLLSHGAAVRDLEGRPLRIAGSQTDITARKLTDAVTGLPNRLFFLDRLQWELESAGGDSSRVAVLFLDLDRFRMMNDSLGHAATDELLTQVAGRLRSTARSAARELVVARTGEDEFALLLTDLQRPSDAVGVARETLKRLRDPFYLEGKRWPVGASIGIALVPAPTSPMTCCAMPKPRCIRRRCGVTAGWRSLTPACGSAPPRAWRW